MDVGAPELILILVIAMVVFGAGKLGQVGSALGKSVREFHKAADSNPAVKTTPPPAMALPSSSSDGEQTST